MFNTTPTRRSQSSLSNQPNNQGLDVQDSTRKRQSKKDDAIRRKIENDLKKKNNFSTIPANQQGTSATLNGSPRKKNSNYAPGSVMSLKPSDPVICKPSQTVYEAAQMMSITKENCVLVVDDVNEELLGIFTAKDLAFRIVGSSLSANKTTIDQIMTPNPMCCKISTLASDALTLMVNRGFRHLPVINDSNQIIGVLDITKCYNEAMSKLERMYESSKKLYDAMESVNAEMGSNNQPLHVTRYFENLKNLINGPTLNSVLDDRTIPVYCDIKTSVYDAAILMKENKTTAVLVKDSTKNDEVTGIFTSKDVVLRVIAAGIDPKTCSVIRVMTPKPDYASSEISVHQALRKMFDGRYLNLPVVDNQSNEIVGIVEVLKLTYCTLNQIKSMQSINSGSHNHESDSQISMESEGPAWNKFWALDNDSDSIHSSSIVGPSTNDLANDVTQSELAQFGLNSANIDTVKPSDSISFAGVDVSSPVATKVSNIELKLGNVLNSPAEVDFDEPFVFKFKSPLGRTHRISFKPNDGIESLRDLISSKLSKQEKHTLVNNTDETSKTQDDEEEGETFSISYLDDENDIIAITSSQDLKDCVFWAKNLSFDKLDLYIHHPDKRPDIDTDRKSINSKKLNSAPGSRAASAGGDNFVQELILPGALFALAASIIVVFSLSRK